MNALLINEGSGPATNRNMRTGTIANALPLRRPNNRSNKKENKLSKNRRCVPDKARICAQPQARLNSRNGNEGSSHLPVTSIIARREAQALCRSVSGAACVSGVSSGVADHRMATSKRCAIQARLLIRQALTAGPNQPFSGTCSTVSAKKKASEAVSSSAGHEPKQITRVPASRIGRLLPTTVSSPRIDATEPSFP